MQVIMTARHQDVDQETRDHAEALMLRVAKVAHRPHRAEIIFDVEHDQKVVEFHLSLPRGHVHVATGQADTFRNAAHRAADKLRNQLDKAEDTRPKHAAS